MLALCCTMGLTALPFAQPFVPVFSFHDNSVTFTNIVGLPEGNTLVAGQASGQLFVRKLDAQGIELWETQFPGAKVQKLSVDPNGGIYVGSSVEGVTPMTEIRALQPDSGAIRWFNSIPTLPNMSSDLATAKVGNSVLLYSCATSPSASGDMLARRINPATGVAVWTRVIAGNNGAKDVGASVSTNSAGAAFFAGTLKQNGLYIASIFRLNGSDGSTVWRRDSPGNANEGFVEAGPSCVQSNGDVAFAYRSSADAWGISLSAGTGGLKWGWGFGVNGVSNPAPGPLQLSPRPKEGFALGRNTSAISGQLYVLTQKDPKQIPILNPLVLLGFARGNEIVYANYPINGSQSALTRLGGVYSHPTWPNSAIAIQESATILAQVSTGALNADDECLVAGPNFVARYRTSIRLTNDSFGRPFVDGKLTEPAGALFENDLGVGGGTPELWTQPEHGSVVINQDGSFTYTKGAGFVDTDTFRYRVVRGTTVSEVATVRVTDLKILDVTFDMNPAFAGEDVKATASFNGSADPGKASWTASAPVIGQTGLQFMVWPGSSALMVLESTPVTQTTNASVTYRIHGLSKSATLTFHPGSFKTFTVSKMNLIGGEVITGRVELHGPPPVDRLVTITGFKDVIVPESMTIPVGATFGEFTIKSKHINYESSLGVIRIKVGNTEAARSINIRHHPLIRFVAGPNSMTGGTTANYTATLDVVTPFNYPVILTTTGPLTAPASIVVGTGYAGKTFAVQASTVTTSTTGTITGKTGGFTATKTVQVNP